MYTVSCIHLERGVYLNNKLLSWILSEQYIADRLFFVHTYVVISIIYIYI